MRFLLISEGIDIGTRNPGKDLGFSYFRQVKCRSEKKGEIDPKLLTAAESLQRRIQCQPLLEWKALNVRQYKLRGE